MKALIRYKYHLIAVVVLLGLLSMGVKVRVAKPSETAKDLPRIEVKTSLNHADELLPKRLRVALDAVSNREDLRGFILDSITQSLPASQKAKAFEVARAVITEANHHHMDPLFLLAVIETESGFNITARGQHGEIGLMQVMPKTANWLARRTKLPANFDLNDPSVNIRLGAAYFASLRKKFNGVGRRYVAAYNMGTVNVNRLLAIRTEPKIYPDKVMGNYRKLYGALASTATADLSRHVASMR